MKIEYKISVLLVAILIAGTSMAGAFPSFAVACNGGGSCHAYPPASFNITTDITSIAVSPNQSFTVNMTWSGGGTSNAVKWPGDFSNINISRDNTKFNPDPVLPFQGPNSSGTTFSTLTAPEAPGSYMVRVYVSGKNPFETDFKDIAITVQAPQSVPGAPSIVNFSPSQSVTDLPGASRTFSITANQTVNVTWLINGTTAFGQNGVTTSSYNNTSAAPGTWNVTAVASNDNGTVSQKWDWTVTEEQPGLTGSISGFKINDTSGNGKQDAGETGLPGWKIELKGIGRNHIKKETFTDAAGFYKFDNLSAGKYILKEKHEKGFVPTSPPVKVIKLAVGENSTNNNFTNMPGQCHKKDRDSGDDGEEQNEEQGEQE